MGKAGLEKVMEAEEAYLAKYQARIENNFYLITKFISSNPILILIYY